MSVHVFYGYAKRESEPDDTCLYCNAHEEFMAYAYFGGPVCGRCWDGRWRQEEDGKTDPPFAKITRRVSGEWLTDSNPAIVQSAAGENPDAAGGNSGRSAPSPAKERNDG